MQAHTRMIKGFQAFKPGMYPVELPYGVLSLRACAWSCSSECGVIAREIGQAAGLSPQAVLNIKNRKEEK